MVQTMHYVKYELVSNRLILSTALFWLLLGCQSEPEVEKAGTATTPEVHEQAGDNGEEIVWADLEFLEQAGVKAGKDVMFLPTPPMVVDKMIELAKIQPTDLVYDLGTGDGRLAIAAAKQTGCRAVGYDIDPELVEKARENVRKNGVEHLVTIEQQDILTLDFGTVDVVLMFLTSDLNVELLPRLAKLKPGARVVSHDYDMKGIVEPDLAIENFRSKVPDFLNVHNIYLWKAPLQRTDAE